MSTGLALVLLAADTSRSQPFFYGLSSRFELSDSLDVPEADADTKARLEQAHAFVADHQWDEAIETIRQVMEGDQGRVIPASDQRYVSVREYCHMRLAALPEEALALYRGRVDAQAKRLLDDGLARRDSEPVSRVVDHFLCSSVGDEALLALGEMALEQGDHGGARRYWERLIETPPRLVRRDVFERVVAAETTTGDERRLLDRWYRPDSAAPPSDYVFRDETSLDDPTRGALVELWRERGLSSSRLAYPRSDIDLATVRARLILVSILEGSLERARNELASFQAMHPEAKGRLGGLDVNYGEALAATLEKAQAWPQPTTDADWPTFAGSPARSKASPMAPKPEVVLWQKKGLPKPPNTESGYPSPRVAEAKTDLLSYHPIVVGSLVLVNTPHEIRAYDVLTGRPAWGDDEVIYRPSEPVRELSSGPGGTLGVARFTMTAHSGRIYARMGDPLTSRPEENSIFHQPCYLLCLDLRGEGRIVWPPVRPEDKWAFEGSPIVDGDRLYVALRHGARPQAHVACYDARTGRPLWRQFVAAAETPARGQAGECTHNLLTLAHGMLYFNTNLGAVAALSADNGRLQWITHYRRAKKGDLNQRAWHFYRDLTPCVYDRGRLFVAPSDSESILALDAATGLLIWETTLPKDVVHLLGVGGDTLWASGEKLWKINVETGKVGYPWPEGPAPKGFGRGTLAGGKVYWPTQKEIYVFDARSGQEEPPLGLAAMDGAVSGNLVAAGEVLIVAASEQLLALGPVNRQVAQGK
ncbi:MAG: PQQ-binding-like beta-propeller repeat protein [Planctomycetia bacterium]|nr:PQQ-binding-like beta-propeller repeat protein [Planctomycetia bacterium]